MENYIEKSKFKQIIFKILIFSMALILAAFGAGFFIAKIQPRPGPDSGTVVENPTKKQANKADVKFTEQKTGQLTSRVKVDPKPPIGTESTPVSGHTPEPKLVLTLQVGDKFSAPAAGKIKTVYLDSSGRQIGEGVHQVAGETEVIVGKEWLDIKTSFQDLTTVAVDVPDPPKKVNHIGLNIVTNFDRFSLGGYAQRDFYFWQSNWIDGFAFARVEKDWEWRAKAGIEFSF